MHLQRITVPRVRETSPKAIGAGARTVDAGLGHPDLTQFANELAAAAPDAGPDTARADRDGGPHDRLRPCPTPALDH